MYQVNRSVVVMRPKEPFLKWLLQFDTYKQIGFGLEELQRDCTTLLVPNFDDEESALEFVYTQYEALFELELEAWVVDEDTWPENRSLTLFKAWFDVEYHRTVIDLVEDEFETTTSTALH